MSGYLESVDTYTKARVDALFAQVWEALGQEPPGGGETPGEDDGNGNGNPESPDLAAQYAALSAYNFTSTSMAKFKAAWARQAAGQGRARVVAVGDSIVQGYGAATPASDNSWIGRLRTSLDSKAGVVSGCGWLRPDVAGLPEPRVAIAPPGNWTALNTGPFTQDRGATVAGSTITVAGEFDRLRIHYARFPGGGSVTATLDGQPVAPIDGDFASLGQAYADYTATQGTHTLELTVVGDGMFDFLGAELTLNGQARGCELSDVSYGGNAIHQFYDTSKADVIKMGATFVTKQLSPDLVILSFGLNELNNSMSMATTWKNYMQDAITKIKSDSGASILMMIDTPPSATNDPLSGFDDMVQAYYDLADANDCALIDYQAVAGTYEEAVAKGLMHDSQHPSNLGYAEMHRLASGALALAVTG